nr:hypothetical protein [Tanacetum cinerariifolium]
FWSIVVAKTINGEGHIHARVDGKKVIIIESSIIRDLQLADEEGVECLPNYTIFKQLALMGSTVASAIICLATSQKINFSKWIFDSMIRNLDNVSGKFLMYPRFVQLFLDKQLDEMSNHEGKYISPTHTKKSFRNMRRVGNDFSGRITPLFSTMTQKPRKPTRKVTEVPQPSDPIKHVADEAVHKKLGDSLVRVSTTASSLEAE